VNSREGARRVRLIAPASQAGQRLDQFLASHLTTLSRSQVQRLIRDGHVTLSRGRAKAGLLTTPGLEVDVEIPAPVAATPQPEPLPLSIVYDDADLVVIDKPAGLVVHPAAGHARGTLVNALLHHVPGLSGIGGTVRPGIVHRLDRGTSGLMVIAKHDRAHRALAAQFHDRTVGKEYIALVWGAARAGLAIDKPIGRHPRQRQKMSTRSPRGRPAATRVVEATPLGAVTLIRVSIGTGRTHQIRVHLSDAGHPIVGDTLYGGTRRPAGRRGTSARLERPFLHAARLSFDHPADGRRLTFDSPLPDDLQRALEQWR
jgi:23S rRNA pseudouridine1911/1915/1917 synthase